MGKSSPSPPPPPDYAGAAQAQGTANLETAVAQNYMSNPNVYGPLGNQVVTFGANNQPTITQNLTPAAQATLNSQQQVQQGLANLGTQGLTQAGGLLSTPFKPNVPGLQTSVSGPGVHSLNYPGGSAGINVSAGTPQGGPAANVYGLAGGVGASPTLQSAINTSGLAAMPVSAGTTAQQAITSRLEPDIVREQAALRNRLVNQGLRPGGEAYNREMEIADRSATDRRLQAAAQGIGLDFAAQQQGFGQAAQQAGLYNQALQNQYGMGLTSQQLANQAVGQNFGQGLQAQAAQNVAQQQLFGQQMGTQQAQNAALQQNQQAAIQGQQAQNQAAAQQFNQNLQGAQFGNTAQQQALAQQLMLYQQPLNQITALMSGSQTQMPQFQGYQGSSVAPPPIFGATQATGQAAMDQYGIQSANANAANAGLYSMLGAGIGAYPFSDRRLKSNIVQVGTHPLGIGVYEYDIFGRRDVGVMADEVLEVRPEAVITHPSGYMMVNYGMLT